MLFFRTHSRFAPMARNGLLTPSSITGGCRRSGTSTRVSAARLGPAFNGAALHVERDRDRM